MVIGLNNNYLNVMSLSKIKNNFYIEANMNYDIGLNVLLSEEKNYYKKELLNKIRRDYQVNKKYDGLFFNIQNEQVIIRNIQNIKDKKESYIIGLIKFEINQYIPIDLQDYSIKYKKIRDENGQELIQGILLPKSIIELCVDLSNQLKINNKHLNLDFDILEKLIKLKLINDLEENKVSYIIKNRNDDLIINCTYNNQVIESYIRIKDEKTKEYLKKLCKSSRAYYYGLSDVFMDETQMKILNVKSKSNIYSNDKNEEITTKYISALGMII